MSKEGGNLKAWAWTSERGPGPVTPPSPLPLVKDGPQERGFEGTAQRLHLHSPLQAPLGLWDPAQRSSLKDARTTRRGAAPGGRHRNSSNRSGQRPWPAGFCVAEVRQGGGGGERSLNGRAPSAAPPPGGPPGLPWLVGFEWGLSAVGSDRGTPATRASFSLLPPPESVRPETPVSALAPFPRWGLGGLLSPSPVRATARVLSATQDSSAPGRSGGCGAGPPGARPPPPLPSPPLPSDVSAGGSRALTLRSPSAGKHGAVQAPLRPPAGRLLLLSPRRG